MMTKTDWTPLAEAIAAIAARCDGAREDDGRGFNAGDVPLGHYVAGIPAELWDDDVAIGAYQLARTYRAQLAAIGIELEDLPIPDQPERAVRDELTDRRQAQRDAERIAALSFCEPGIEDGKPVIVLGFPYDPDMVEQTKQIPGRAYRAEFGDRSRVNLYPPSSAPVVRDFCREHGIPVEPEVEEMADNPPAPAVPETPAEPNISFTADGSIAIRFDAYPGNSVLDDVRAIPGRRWDKPACAWIVPAAAAAQVVDLAKKHALRLADGIAAQADGAAARAACNLRASIALTPERGEAAVPGLVGTLKPHQHAGLEFIAANRRVLIGDKMGLGKTLLSLAAVAADDAWPAVIACKTSLRLNWQAEVAKFFPGRTVFVASGNAPTAVPADTDVIVIGFDVLKETYKAKVDGRSVTRRGWATALAKLNPKALIVDESHFGKEAAAARSQAMEALGVHVAKREGLVLCLSGTAIVNRPKELLQQLRIMGRLEDMGGEWPFKYRYCGAQTGEWGTTFDGASNLEELHLKLRTTGIYLRRGVMAPETSNEEEIRGISD